MANSKKSMVTAVFRNRFNADAAWRWLTEAGYGASEINMLMSENTRDLYSGEPEEESITAGSYAATGIAAGGAVGTVVGATAGIIAAVGTSLVIPGLGFIVSGPVAATLAAAFAGGGAGAVTGGLVGGLIGLGIPESNAKAYDQILRQGGVAIGVVPRNSNDASRIKKKFEEFHGENVVIV